METGLDSGLKNRMENARKLRDVHFRKEIIFARPTRTTSISMTGAKCELDCAHCGGKYLEHMVPVESAEKVLRCRGSTSCLLSGGCNQDGSVPINIKPIESWLGRIRVNAHVGLVTEEKMKALAPYLDCVSFDFVVDNETIKEVYQLEKTDKDYCETYRMLRKYAKVAPHICIGLKGGKIKGEYLAIERLAQMGVDELVFIVFRPTPGTGYAACSPPCLDEVLDVMVYARELLPNTLINLGCMRPGGKYRRELDYYAVDVGINKIVNPARIAEKRARELGYTVVYDEECCVL